MSSVNKLISFFKFLSFSSYIIIAGFLYIRGYQSPALIMLMAITLFIVTNKIEFQSMQIKNLNVRISQLEKNERTV